MRISAFEEALDAAYDARTREEREQGTVDWWYHDGWGSLTKKPIQALYKKFTKNGRFKIDEAHEHRHACIDHLNDGRSVVLDENDTSEHDYNYAIQELRQARKDARTAGLAFRNAAERAVMQSAHHDDRYSMYSTREFGNWMAKELLVFAVKDFEDRPYNTHNVLRLRRHFDRALRDLEDQYDTGDEGGPKDTNDHFGRDRRDPPLRFIKEEFEGFDIFFDKWYPHDLVKQFIEMCDPTDRLATAAATEHDPEKARQVLERLTEMKWIARKVAVGAVETQRSNRRNLWTAYNQMKDLCQVWEDVISQIGELNAGELDDLIDNAKGEMSLMRSTRYKLHICGDIYFPTPRLLNLIHGNGVDYMVMTADYLSETMPD